MLTFSERIAHTFGDRIWTVLHSAKLRWTAGNEHGVAYLTGWTDQADRDVGFTEKEGLAAMLDFVG